MAKRIQYCTHALGRRSHKNDRCFKTDAAAVRFCEARASRGRCCEVYRRKVRGR
jgi:hypothetical protein